MAHTISSKIKLPSGYGMPRLGFGVRTKIPDACVIWLTDNAL